MRPVEPTSSITMAISGLAVEIAERQRVAPPRCSAHAARDLLRHGAARLLLDVGRLLAGLGLGVFRQSGMSSMRAYASPSRAALRGRRHRAIQ
jgi:hypothetical protein